MFLLLCLYKQIVPTDGTSYRDHLFTIKHMLQ